MIITKSKLYDWIQQFATVFMLASFLLFDSYAWGKYSFFLCAVIVFLIYLLKNGGRFRIRIDAYVILSFLFLSYVALSALWAISPSDSLTMARTLLRVFICFLLIYWAYIRDNNPDKILLTIVFASYIVAIYTLTVNGIDQILSFTDDIRRSKSYANVNSIALFLVFGVVCNLFLILYRGFRMHSLISVLSVAIVIATRSRKAIVFLILGVLGLILFRYSKSKNPIYTILRAFTILLFSFVLLYYLARLPIFSGAKSRLDQMINTFLGSGKMDSSSVMRKNLIRLGLACFQRKPLTGIGMACTYRYAAMNLFFNSYLHNNYVELLAGGGLPAFVLYYSIYAVLIFRCIRIRRLAPQWFALCSVLIVLLLITDYGRVSYYSKTVLFEIMSLFLILEYASSRKEGTENDEKAAQISP